MDICSSILKLLILGWYFTSAHAWLRDDYYSSSCPLLELIVRSAVKEAVAKEPRIAASILRLHFHDCFVQGCDASILLDGSASEKFAVPNNRSVRGFEVIDDIKSKVEAACTGLVSCADILALAARDSVAELGGPEWILPLGRRDSKNANAPLANTLIPPPTLNLANLTKSFQNQGLSIQDMVVLSGSHTIGQARCTTFRGHIYNDTNIDISYAKSLQSNCPSQANSGDANLAPLDLRTPTVFNNDYFKNLLQHKGLLHSDQELFNGGSTDSLVKLYAEDLSTFFIDFAVAMVKMGNINPLTGTAGEIRSNCRSVN